MGSKFFYALGYFTPENYIVYFNPEQLVVEPGTRWIDHRGVERDMTQNDISRFSRTCRAMKAADIAR